MKNLIFAAASWLVCAVGAQEMALPQVGQSAVEQYALGVRSQIGIGAPKDEAKAVEYYRQAAEQGLPEAQHALARCYDRGIGVQKDFAEGAKWFRAAAEQGHANAQVSYSHLLLKGEGVPKNEEEGIRWLRMAVEQGLPRAQQKLAMCYRHGEGVPQDHQASAQVVRLAAEQGYAPSLNSLAWAYEYGLGLPQDREESLRLYQLAAEQGERLAFYNIGRYYGNALERDMTQAIEWFFKSAQRGYCEAQAAIAYNYLRGKGGLPRDVSQAEKWARLAAEQNCPRGMHFLGRVYAKENDIFYNPAQAAEWYKKAIETSGKMYDSMNELGVLYLEGKGVDRDQKLAVELFQKASDHYYEAVNNLGRCYEHGWGVEKDEKKAAELYRRVARAENGDGLFEAQMNLARCYFLGIGIEQNEELAAAWWKEAAVGIMFNYKPAMNNIGVCYELGRGVEQDMDKALKWYHKGAEARDPHCSYNLGRCYEYGIGVEQDRQEAAKFYLKSVASRFKPALVALDRLGLQVHYADRRGHPFGAAVVGKGVSSVSPTAPVDEIPPPRFTFDPLTTEEAHFPEPKVDQVFFHHNGDPEENEPESEVEQAEELLAQADEFMQQGEERKAVMRLLDAEQLQCSEADRRLAMCALFGIGMKRSVETACEFALSAINRGDNEAVIVMDLIELMEKTSEESNGVD